MSNYFEYQDFAKVDRAEIALSSSDMLQEGSDIEQLRYGVEPYDYASFNQNAYITAKPKRLASATDKFGFLTSAVSGANGETDVEITITLPSTYTLSGITLGCVNLLSSVTISYANAGGVTIREETFDSEYITEKLQFFNMVGEGVRFIKITIHSTESPYSFIGVYRIDLGSLRIFDETNLIGAEVNSYFSVDGSTIEYDTAKLKIFHEDNVEYAFLKKQPLVYKDSSGKVINKFFIESGESENEYISTLKAYDSIANLEGKFLGGKYGFGNSEPYPVMSLLDDILGDTGVSYNPIGINNIYVTGYIPICTKRKALAMLCRGTNIRCFKSGSSLAFMPFSLTDTEEYTDNEIVENPLIKRKQTIGRLNVAEHNYEISNEEVELYNWYLQKGENTEQIVEFSQPVWKVVPYEVTRTDTETGMDVVEPSTNITFLEYPSKSNNIANHVKIGRLNTANKVVLKGYKINDNTTQIVASRDSFDINAEYAEKSIDDITLIKTVVDNGKNKKQTQGIANTLFAIESTKVKQTFEVVEVEMPKAGKNVKTSLFESPVIVTVADKKGNTSGVVRNIKISSVKDDLSGVYKVVAE